MPQRYPILIDVTHAATYTKPQKQSRGSKFDVSIKPARNLRESRVQISFHRRW
jgi:hypothetical protein